MICVYSINEKVVSLYESSFARNYSSITLACFELLGISRYTLYSQKVKRFLLLVYFICCSCGSKSCLRPTLIFIPSLAVIHILGMCIYCYLPSIYIQVQQNYNLWPQLKHYYCPLFRLASSHFHEISTSRHTTSMFF